MFFNQIFSLFFVLLFIACPLKAEYDLQTTQKAYETLKLSDIEGPLRYENDHELTRLLIHQTQAQLEDFEKFSEEYERFCEIEEKFMQKEQDNELVRKLIASSLILDDIMQRRNLEGFFSPLFNQQIRFFAQMAKKPQLEEIQPLNTPTDDSQ
jgi:hypothetical protein